MTCILGISCRWPSRCCQVTQFTGYSSRTVRSDVGLRHALNPSCRRPLPLSEVSSAATGKPQQLPFLLTTQQGEAARTLLRYVASLDLPGPEAQLVAVVVAIRAARGGVGNLTGTDLHALRLSDARGAVDSLRGLGWQVDGALFDGDPATPVPVTVPDLAREADHPLPFGKNTRSRVSGWTTRTLSAKPVKKLPPAARLASLFLAAHSTSKLLGKIPPGLPEGCRAALPELLRKGFLAELSEDRCRLDPAVRHLSGMRHPTEEERAARNPKGEGTAVIPATPGYEFSADAWLQWKSTATPRCDGMLKQLSTAPCVLCIQSGWRRRSWFRAVLSSSPSTSKPPTASGSTHTQTAAGWRPSSPSPFGPSTVTAPRTPNCARAWDGT